MASAEAGFDQKTKAGRLRQWALEAVDVHEQDGALPTTLRHLFYEAAMAKIVAKGDPTRSGRGRRPDQDLTDAMTWLRERGHVPWSWIEDRTRHITDYRGNGATIVEGIGRILPAIRIDPWHEVLPIVVAESESGAGGLTPIAHQYRVPVIPTRGQSQGWLRTAIPQAFGGQAVAVCYLGDADKAGVDIENNTHRVLDEVLNIKEWERVALTWDQVEAHGLPTLARVDKRDRMTYEVCELEALPQRILLAAVADWLDLWPHVDLEHVHEREQAEREALADLLGLEPAESE